MQTISRLSTLSTLSNLSSIYGSSVQNDIFTYFFDGVDDYIQRNASDAANLTTTTSVVMSCWCKLNVDSTDTASSQPLLSLPFCYLHIRNTNNQAVVRFDNTGSRASSFALGTGFRDRVNIIGVVQNNGNTTFTTKIYINGVLQSSDTHLVGPLDSIDAIPLVGKRSTSFFSGNIRDARVYTGTITDADALSIYNGSEPTTAVKYFQYLPESSETGTNAKDNSQNNRDATLFGGVQRHKLVSLPLVSKVEYFSNTIGSTSTTNALTLTNTFNTNYSIVIPTGDPKGSPRGTTSDSINSSITKSYSYLTAGNQLTSIRNTGTTTPVTNNGYVVELNSTLVNKVIQGTVTLAAVASNTVTGINCDPANSIVLISGLSSNATGSNIGQQLHTLQLSGTTGNVTLTAQKGSAATTSTVNYYIIEFNPTYINAIQKFSITQGASIETTAVATTYDLANTILFPAGMRSTAAATNANSVVQYAYLKNSTTVAVRSPYYTALATTTHTFSIVPFKQNNGVNETYLIMNGAQNVNNTNHTMGAVSTSTYTLPRSVTVNKSFILPSGVAINETAALSSYDLPSTQITATNTVTATREGTTLSAELGYQVIESV